MKIIEALKGEMNVKTNKYLEEVNNSFKKARKPR